MTREGQPLSSSITLLERRCALGDVRAEGRRLSGTVVAFGDVSESHRERFAPGSLRVAEAISFNLFHDPERAVAWAPGGGLAFRRDDEAMYMTADLPPIPAADRALALIRTGEARGLSAEFRAEAERREAGLRVIEQAVLHGVGLVSRPSYGQSRVEARARRRRVWL